jgi:acetoin utilization deacetylase AcuC-like enzyme
MSFLIVTSDDFADHLTPPGHPESPERAEILAGVAERARVRGVPILEPREATDAELTRVHTWSHVAAIESTRGRSVMIDEDTFTSPDTGRIARLAAGAAVVAVSASADALVLVRPPGHHADPGQAMGFCFYNNVAVAAAAARASGLARVAIVDIDVHHGNGTERMFYGDRSVLFISTHQYPLYPGTGAANDIGSGEGLGYTVNVPIEAGATDGDYEEIAEAVIVPLLAEYAPQLVLVSAGFDAHEDDPLAQMRLTTEGYRSLATRLRQSARNANCPIVFVTEGGYALGALAASLDAVVDVMVGEGPPAAPASTRSSTGRGARAIASVRAAQGARWRSL